MLGAKQHEILSFLARILVLEQFQVDDISALDIDSRKHRIGVNPHTLPKLARRRQCGWQRIDALPRGCPRLSARHRHRPLRWRAGRGGRAKLLLPRLPEEQQRESEHEKEDQTLSIHRGSGKLRDRIMAARVPGMTARKAREGEPRAPRRAVALERLQRVCGAGGMETAVQPKQRAQTVAITADQER